MKSTYSLRHLSDFVLLRDLKDLVARDRATTAALLAHIAEVDSRKLYLAAAYPSMYTYCVHELRLSEEAAFKRIHAARVARRFPAIFGAIAAGRLQLSAVIMLAPHLTEHTADELLVAAERKTRSEIESLLANRFPRPDLPAQVLALAAPGVPLTTAQHAPGRVYDNGVTSHAANDAARASEPFAARPTVPQESRPRVTPLSPQRFAFQATIDQSTHDKLRHAQELLGHRVPNGDLATVLDRALDALVRELERQRFAATDRPKGNPQPSSNPRQIPNHVKREVWKRDQGQCTFVNETGKHCPSRTCLEFDHVHEVARGGEASVENLRLRCRAHNEYTAECRFGTEFMERKRTEARLAAAHARAVSHRTAAVNARARADSGADCISPRLAPP